MINLPKIDFCKHKLAEIRDIFILGIAESSIGFSTETPIPAGLKQNQ
jgi:hypothetical protein